MSTLGWHRISDVVNARPGRERLLITLTALIILHMVTFYIIQPELKAMQMTAVAGIAPYHAQIERRSHDIHQVASEYTKDSDSAVVRKIARLQAQINQFGSSLARISDSFVDPHEMITLVKSLLNASHLQVRRLENIPPEAITDNKAAIEIYKHGIYVEISGSYHNHIRFLKKLEKLPWQIFWDELQLHADEKGTSTIGLTIYTLNYNPTWLEI